MKTPHKRDLLFSVTKKEFRVETFKSRGAGGQHRDKTDNCVKITHIDSGAVGQSTESRSQTENKRVALKRLTQTVKWKVWSLQRIAEEDDKRADRKTLEQRVEASMSPRNLRVDVKNEGKWEEAPSDLCRPE